MNVSIASGNCAEMKSRSASTSSCFHVLLAALPHPDVLIAAIRVGPWAPPFQNVLLGGRRQAADEPHVGRRQLRDGLVLELSELLAALVREQPREALTETVAVDLRFRAEEELHRKAVAGRVGVIRRSRLEPEREPQLALWPRPAR